MPQIKGRTIEVWRGAPLALVASVRTKSMTLNGEPYDVTTDDDDGVRKLLADAAEVSAEISVEGLTVDGHALAAESDNIIGRVQPTEFRLGAVEKFAGDFFLASYSPGNGEYKGVATFAATFQSAGAVTYTPPV